MNHFKQIRAKLSDLDLDGMLLTGEANRFYASGFHSMGTDGVAVVTQDKAYFFTDSRYMEAALRYVQGAELEQTSLGRGYGVLVNEVVERHHIEKLGFEEDYITVADWESYRKALHCELLPATQLLQELRCVKDEEEISALTAAQRIAEKAFADIVKEIRVGITEREIAARLHYLMLHYGGEKMSFDPIVLAGANGSLPHGTPSDHPIAAGEFLTIDFGCIYHGYCSDMTRTVAVGYATGEMQLIYQTVLQAQRAGIERARAGVTGREVDEAARSIIAAAGYGENFGHGFGHGVGVEIHEAPNASPAYQKALPVGAVISAEPGIYLPGKLGVRIEDVVLLQEQGCLNLTKAPKELMIL